jgi:hypothetical protein
MGNVSDQGQLFTVPARPLGRWKVGLAPLNRSSQFRLRWYWFWSPRRGRYRKAWGVSPRNTPACNFSKPQRGGTELCAAAPCTVHRSMSPRWGLEPTEQGEFCRQLWSWGSRPRLYDSAAPRLRRRRGFAFLNTSLHATEQARAARSYVPFQAQLLTSPAPLCRESVSSS